MARPRQFDLDQALEKAMRLFWEKGYFDSSVDDLVVATGMNRHSLYALFGGKRELFLEALRRYWWQVAWERMRGLVDREPGLPEIEAYFRELARTRPERRLGCLFWSGAAELAPQDPEVAEMVRSAAAFLTSRFELALANARRKGALYSGIDVRRTASALTAQAQGMSVLARAGSRQCLKECSQSVVNGFSLKLQSGFWE